MRRYCDLINSRQISLCDISVLCLILKHRQKRSPSHVSYFMLGHTRLFTASLRVWIMITRGFGPSTLIPVSAPHVLYERPAESPQEHLAKSSHDAIVCPGRFRKRDSGKRKFLASSCIDFANVEEVIFPVVSQSSCE